MLIKMTGRNARCNDKDMDFCFIVHIFLHVSSYISHLKVDSITKDVYWHKHTISSNERYNYLYALEARCLYIDLITNSFNYKTDNVLKNVTVRRFHISIVAWKSITMSIFRVCFFLLIYPACKAHRPYCHLWLVLL